MRAGFIGSHVVDILHKQGHDVVVYDRLVEQVHGKNGPRYLPAGVQFVQADVADRGRLAKALVGVEQIVHLAAEVGVGQSMYEISRYVNANTGGTGVLLDILANEQHTVSKIVVASSMSIYGEGGYTCAEHGSVYPRQRTEAQLRRRDWELHCPACDRELSPVATAETKPVFPSSVYAISKMDQELLCLAVGAAYGIGVTALRYFNTYGPRQSLSNPYTGVAAVFSSRLLNGRRPIVNEDGQQKRDFIHVRDVAQATVAALTAPEASGRAINIGVGDPISILEVAQLLAMELSVDLDSEITGQFRTGDIRHCWADPSQAKELLDFEPIHRFRDQGIKELVEWVRGQTTEDNQAQALAELTRRGLNI